MFKVWRRIWVFYKIALQKNQLACLNSLQPIAYSCPLAQLLLSTYLLKKDVEGNAEINCKFLYKDKLKSEERQANIDFPLSWALAYCRLLQALGLLLQYFLHFCVSDMVLGIRHISAYCCSPLMVGMLQRKLMKTGLTTARVLLHSA